MAKTVLAMYEEFLVAQRVTQDLVNAGFKLDDINLISKDERRADLDAILEEADYSDVGQGAAIGAGVGVALGGIGAALATVAIPGIGPIIAAGPLIAALIGAGVGGLTGGVAGGLIKMDVPENYAHYYAEGIRRGGKLVALQTDEGRVQEALDIMNDYNPIDIDRCAAKWRETGWHYSDPSDNSSSPTAGDQDQDRDLFLYDKTDVEGRGVPFRSASLDS